MSGSSDQTIAGPHLVEAANELLSLATQQLEMRATQRDALERALVAGGTERNAVVDAIFSAAGLPSFFRVDESDADEFVSQLTAIEAQWNHLSLRWNEEDADGEALNSSPLLPLMAMVAADSKKCDLELWVFRHDAWEGSASNAWTGWLAAEGKRAAVQACVDTLGLPAYPWSSRPTLVSSIPKKASKVDKQTAKASQANFAFHPSLKKLSHACLEWMENAGDTHPVEDLTNRIRDHLDAPGVVAPRVVNAAISLSQYFQVAAADAYFRAHQQDLAQFFRWAVDLRSLLLRCSAAFCRMRPDGDGWPEPFTDSLKAVSPVVLSSWPEAQLCAQGYLEMVEQDQRVNTDPKQRNIKGGSSDAFVAYLLSDAFGTTTSFKLLIPVIPDYQVVLDNWRTLDADVFAASMSKAADFHISRSKQSTDRTTYEFSSYFEQVFATELLAVQALRKRDGLIALDTNHALVDGPWSVLQALSEAPPHPLTAEIEARMRRDYPTFH